MSKQAVSNRDFVVAYASADSVERVAEVTGMTRAAIYSRRNALSKKGVKFPKLGIRRGMTELEVAQLNSLVRKHDIRRHK